MLWNELDFEIQSTVLLKIINLVDSEDNVEIRDALRSAFLELRMWSNFPCQVIEESTDPAVQAQDAY